MKIYRKEDVLTAAKERISFLFDEFEHVVVCISGGKDSTVIYNLCMAEAEKRGRLPLEVCFIDQEAEWESTIRYVKSIMYDERVKPYWLQVPVKLFNATSHESDNWLHCWYESEKWMRERDPIAIHENTYGTDRFKPLFVAFMRKTFEGMSACGVSGVRAEESPARTMALTATAKYKHITWGKNNGTKNNPSYAFYPIYDWSYTDVWHAIYSNKWKYNSIYDAMYRYGVPVHQMRVSNLNHETAVRSLYYVREVEPQTWDKLTARMNGVDTTSKVSYKDNFKAQDELPFMFRTWQEYRDYLLENLVTDAEQNRSFKNEFDKLDEQFIGDNELFDSMCKVCVASILANDYTFTKLNNFRIGNNADVYRRIRRHKKIRAEYAEHTRDLLERIDDAR